MRNWFWIPLCFLLFLVFTTKVALAKSDYVLPYPSAMPGSIFYKLNLIKEEVLRYWYFGDFGQFKYNLSKSDKYLVEAKTLFEYKQYFLGLNALYKSKGYYNKSYPFLLKAHNKGKDTRNNLILFESASVKHIEILLRMKSEIPEEFTWEPEKSSPTKLYLHKEIEDSIKARQK